MKTSPELFRQERFRQPRVHFTKHAQHHLFDISTIRRKSRRSSVFRLKPTARVSMRASNAYTNNEMEKRRGYPATGQPLLQGRIVPTEL
jgi:hypothetical protein